MTGILILARLGSSRLPEKHLLLAEGKAYIQWLAERILFEFEEEIDEEQAQVVLCTSDEFMNRKFENYLGADDVKYFYGEKNNLARRQFDCARKMQFDKLICIDGDDVLCSTAGMRKVYDALQEEGAQFIRTKGLPFGMNCMGYSFEFLKECIRGNYSAMLETGWGRILDESAATDIEMGKYDDRKLRFSLDYEQDDTFFKKIFAHFGSGIKMSSDEEIISYVNKNKLYDLNASVVDEYWKNFEEQRNKEIEAAQA